MMTSPRSTATREGFAATGTNSYYTANKALLGGTLWKEQEWDVDNPLKAFFDALTDVEFFGPPVYAGSSMKGDERVDHLEVGKRRGREGEGLGARLEVWLIDRSASPTP